MVVHQSIGEWIDGNNTDASISDIFSNVGR